MVAKVQSASLFGLSCLKIDVEAQVIGALRRFSIVGLPDSALTEAKDRVRCALENSGFSFPHSEVVVSLAPASVPKNGSGFDLAIAVSILAASGRIEIGKLANKMFLGELGLDGLIKPVHGILAAAEVLSKQKNEKSLKENLPDKNPALYVSPQIASAAAIFPGLNVFAVSSLQELVAILNGQKNTAPLKSDLKAIYSNSVLADFGDVIGQAQAKRAFEISAAGGHNLLMLGPPGVGKSMLAKRMLSILPEMTLEESIEVAKIKNTYSDNFSFVVQRPFRSPHHTISAAGLVGGGAIPQAGEVSLAHRGVLFLDELTEVRKDVLESLREPLENKVSEISRAKYRANFPADFILIAAANPCSRGACPKFAPGANKFTVCECSPLEQKRYKAKLSGPLLDRIDMQIWVPQVPIRDLASEQVIENPTESMRNRVVAAREVQASRFKSRTKLNTAMGTKEVKKFCKIDSQSLELLESVAKKFSLSARGFTRLLKLSRTIADLAGEDSIALEQVSEAISYRMSWESL